MFNPSQRGRPKASPSKPGDVADRHDGIGGKECPINHHAILELEATLVEPVGIWHDANTNHQDVSHVRRSIEQSNACRPAISSFNGLDGHSGQQRCPISLMECCAPGSEFLAKDCRQRNSKGFEHRDFMAE